VADAVEGDKCICKQEQCLNVRSQLIINGGQNELLKKAIISIVLMTLAFVAVACSTNTPPSPAPATTPSPETPQISQTAPQAFPVTKATKPAGPVKGTWIEPQVSGDSVSIPLAELEKDWNVHFALNTDAGEYTYMAYIINGKIHVRANTCPPCRSIGYTLADNILVCDRCATTFEAATGNGIKGACVNYPKASVQYQQVGDNIVMQKNDMVVAYQNTLKPGQP
jgi:nitrite reductase/ring-hydroxylating ferredoxin subunit